MGFGDKEQKDLKKENLAKKVLSEDDLKFTINHDGEVFTMLYPLPFTKAAIEAEIARRLGGYSRASFPAEHVAMVEATTYVEAMIIHNESPSWFKSAWTTPDEDLIVELYRGYLQFRGKLQEQLRSD